jgi:cytochrome c-type biogenesis protein CcmH
MRLLMIALALALASPWHANAQTDSANRPANQTLTTDSVLEARTTALASELRCPVCQGNSIQDSPSELAQQMRDLIRDQLRAGKTPDEVRAYFAAKYGEWILLTPRATGFNLVVYLAPLAVLIVGGLVVWRTVKRFTGSAANGPADKARTGA